jgi:nitronate monooxygenase
MLIPALLRDNLTVPVIGSPMFIVSTPDLVIAQCKAGIVGSFPALNARPKEELAVWLERITTELAAYKAAHPQKKVAPFAVNQIVHASNDRLMHDMETCVRFRVPIIITSLRPPGEIIAAAHSYGGIVLHDVINVRHARKAAEAGVDGLILVCAGAGGHAGTLSPFALLPEVRKFFDKTIVLAGAISNGASVLAAQAIGADLAYMGTRFIATAEANAKPEYKQMILKSSAADVVYTALFSGIHGNYLSHSVTAAGFDPMNLPPADKDKMNFGSGGTSHRKAWKDIWSAGQGVGQIDDIPGVEEMVERLQREYASARARLTAQADEFA